MFTHRLLASALALASFVAYADAPQSPPKGLTEYIRNAKAAGLSAAEIQRNAEQAGWPAASIKQALDEPEATPVPPTTGAPVQTKPKATPPEPPRSREAEVQRSVNHNVADDYVIGAGDVLQISVWKEPDASVASVVVRPDGKISMPLLKEASVVGLTPTQAEQRITELLAKFINDADVTVVVSEINSKKVYVVGAVKKEGPIAYTYRMTIMQALSEAGGLTDYAKRKKIYVLRNENGRDFKLPFDYDAVLRGEHMELNVPLRPGDTLVIPH